MMDLPDGFPMYCKDLKQILDHKVAFYMPFKMPFFSSKPKSFEDALERFKNHPNYPKQENEHNALSDARWNKSLFEFLDTL